MEPQRKLLQVQLDYQYLVSTMYVQYSIYPAPPNKYYLSQDAMNMYRFSCVYMHRRLLHSAVPWLWLGKVQERTYCGVWT